MRIYQEKNKHRNAILLQFSLLTDLVPSLGQPNGNYVKTVRMLNNHQNYYNEQILEYAKSGAVKRLQRRGRKNDGHSGKIDNLHITVKGNRLHYVSDDADKLLYDGAFDFNGDASNSSAFQYNANGSLITDTGKGIMFIEYDDNGMPRRIQFADGNVTEYVYTATGRKLRAVYYTAVPGITVGSGETHQLTASEILSKDSIDYLGSLVMENGVPAQYLFAGGYCSLNDVNASGGIGWHYYNYDHLDNNREVVSESGTLEQVTNYYPFGAPFCERTTAGVNTNATLQRYKYNGKELDLMHGLKWYDYGARMYDPILLTWNGIDPLAEKYYSISPYAYCGNNPINRIDPDGMKFLLSNLTDKQLELYNKAIGYLCNNSQLFSNLYKMLDESDNTFIITLGNPVSSSNNSSIDGQFISNDSGGGKIILSESRMMEDNINETVYAEEYFHAFQYENVNSYAKGSFNYEFEAKVYATAVGLETSGFGEYGGMEDFQNSIRKGNYGNSLQPISPQVVNSTRFEKEYRIRANAYAKYNIKNNIGNHKYRMPTTVSPYSLRKIINSTY